MLVLAGLAIALIIGEAKGEYRYKGEMELATEYPAPDEEQAVAAIIMDLEKILTKRHIPPKRMPRDAHPKQHGLVKAEFEVLSSFPDRYKVGIFSEPKTYKAWVRFSTNFNKPDYEKNTRGMAVKLMGVEGQKILPEKADATTHDFVFMSQQYFPTRDAISFSELLKAMEAGKPSLFKYLLTHQRVAVKLMKVDTVSPDLFSVVWGSATPYKLGDDIAVKYIAKSRYPSTEVMPEVPEGEKIPCNYLRERLDARLAREDVIIDFYIQPQLDAKTMPIEDARVIWNEARSPHIKVASIRIPKQTFNTIPQHLYGDQLSFTPWHALPEHQPLGGINRGRRHIYEAISKFRHERNGEKPFEPTEQIEFEDSAKRLKSKCPES